jgi:hypothetical protein
VTRFLVAIARWEWGEDGWVDAFTSQRKLTVAANDERKRNLANGSSSFVVCWFVVLFVVAKCGQVRPCSLAPLHHHAYARRLSCKIKLLLYLQWNCLF